MLSMVYVQPLNLTANPERVYVLVLILELRRLRLTESVV